MKLERLHPIFRDAIKEAIKETITEVINENKELENGVDIVIRFIDDGEYAECPNE